MTLTHLEKMLVTLIWLTLALFVNIRGDIMSDSGLAAAINLVDHHTLEISTEDSKDAMRRDGKFYSGVGPGSTIIAIPFYVLFKPLINLVDGSTIELRNSNLKEYRNLPKDRIFFLQIIMAWFFVAPFSALFIILLRRYFLKASPHEWQNLELVFLFGTMFFNYSCMYSRQIIACLIVWTVLLLFWLYELKTAKWALLMGFALGFTVSVDYGSAIQAMLVGLYLIYQLNNQGRAAAILGAVFAIVPLLIYHQYLCGSPFLTPYEFRVYNEIFGNPALANGDGHFPEGGIHRGYLLGMGLPSLTTFWAITFSVSKGLFICCPILIAGMFGLAKKEFRNFNKEALAVAVILIYIYVNSSLKGDYYWNGWPSFWGPRHLLPITFFIILGLLNLRGLSKKPWFRILISVSILFNSLAAMYQFTKLVYLLNNPIFPNQIWGHFLLLFDKGLTLPIMSFYQIPTVFQSIAVLGLTAVWLFIRSKNSPPQITK